MCWKCCCYCCVSPMKTRLQRNYTFIKFLLLTLARNAFDLQNKSYNSNKKTNQISTLAIHFSKLYVLFLTFNSKAKDVKSFSKKVSATDVKLWLFISYYSHKIKWKHSKEKKFYNQRAKSTLKKNFFLNVQLLLHSNSNEFFST